LGFFVSQIIHSADLTATNSCFSEAEGLFNIIAKEMLIKIQEKSLAQKQPNYCVDTNQL